MNIMKLVFAVALSLAASGATADTLTVDLRPSGDNPASPQMGDNLSYHSAIRNVGAGTVDGLIAWISLVQVDKGKEQPVDLEDWSAHKAVTEASLKPGGVIETDWPIRLIQAGQYRVVISAATRTGEALVTSPFADFSVRQKPVVESQRVMPVAFGIPLILLLAMIRVWRKTKVRAAHVSKHDPNSESPA